MEYKKENSMHIYSYNGKIILSYAELYGDVYVMMPKKTGLIDMREHCGDGIVKRRGQYIYKESWRVPIIGTVHRRRHFLQKMQIYDVLSISIHRMSKMEKMYTDLMKIMSSKPPKRKRVVKYEDYTIELYQGLHAYHNTVIHNGIRMRMEFDPISHLDWGMCDISVYCDESVGFVCFERDGEIYCRDFLNVIDDVEKKRDEYRSLISETYSLMDYFYPAVLA